MHKNRTRTLVIAAVLLVAPFAAFAAKQDVAAQAAAQMITSLDTDQDKTLTLDEYLATSRNAFKTYDLNADGRISMAEMTDFYRKQFKARDEARKRAEQAAASDRAARIAEMKAKAQAAAKAAAARKAGTPDATPPAGRPAASPSRNPSSK